jgi:hypothetical protein
MFSYSDKAHYCVSDYQMLSVRLDKLILRDTVYRCLTTGVVDNGGKFTTDVVNTDFQNFPPLLLTPVVHL